MERDAVRDPIAVGAKVTVRLHLAPAATLAPHVLVCAKSPGLAPAKVMFDMLKVTLPVLVSVTDCGTVVAAMFSCPNARLAAERLIVVAGVTPVPFKLTVCGLPPALSLMRSEALREPAAEGANVTIIVQLPLTPTPLPQSFVWAKSAAFAPLSPMLDRVSEVLPVSESVTLCAVLVLPVLCWANVRLPGERLTTGWSPVPLKLMVCGLLPALSLTVSEALRDPAAEGVNLTVIVQLLPAATLPPQLLVCAKSPAFVPLMARLEIFSEPLPVLERITDCGALVEPTFCCPNTTLAEERLMLGEKSPAFGPEQAAQIPTASSEVASSKHTARRSLATPISSMSARNTARKM